WLQRAGLALLNQQPFDEQGLAPLDAVLLPTAFDDRVHDDSAGVLRSGVQPVLASERRRPPLRPRPWRRDDRESLASAGASMSEATAPVRPASSIRTRCFSPT